MKKNLHQLMHYTMRLFQLAHVQMQPVLSGALQPSRNTTPEGRELLTFIRQPVRYGVKIALAAGFFFIVWAGLAPLDSASIASGSVVMDSNRKTIQHLEGGEIREILVKDGDRVQEGQTLIRLNPVSAKARQDTIESRLFTAKAAEARLVAEKEGAAKLDLAATLKNTNISNITSAQREKIMETQSNLFDQRRKDYVGQGEILDQRIAQSREKIEGVEAQKEAAERQLSLIKEEITTFSSLLKKGLTVKSRLLDLQREKAMLEGSIGSYVAEIANTREKISETETQKINVDAQYQKEVAAELTEVRQEIAEMTEQLTASSDIYRRTEITAPLSGVVTGLRYHTVGGVITPGTPILDIVPDNDTMVIETRIAPQDIDVVHPGLQAKVRLSAYRNRFLPRLHGTLTYVSADKFTDERTQISYYLGRVRIDEEDMQKYGDEFSLYPGMPAEVFIVTGSHTLLEYLLYPLLGTYQRGLSED